MNTYQVLIIVVVDTRILRCVADSLQERHFASISPTNYKDTKVSIFRSEVIGITVFHEFQELHGSCVKGAWERYSRKLSPGASESGLMHHVWWTVVHTNFGYSLDLTNHQGE